MSNPLFTRRAIGAFIASLVTWPSFIALPRSVKSQPLLDIVTPLLDEPSRACTIGKACLLSLAPEERSPVRLHAILQSPAHRDIAQRMRDDFATGVVINVDGWLLSLTEARLYAFIALTMTADTTRPTG